MHDGKTMRYVSVVALFGALWWGNWASGAEARFVQDGRAVLLRNDLVAVSIMPGRGAAITGFRDMRAGHNVVSRPWGEANYFVDLPGAQRAEHFYSSQAFKCAFRKTQNSATVVATCQPVNPTTGKPDPRLLTREMTLFDGSRRLLVRCSIKNTGDKPVGAHLEWSTSLKVVDNDASHYAALVPGGPTMVRKVMGHWALGMQPIRPIWPAALLVNYRNGAGLWVTFRARDVQWVAPTRLPKPFGGIGLSLVTKRHLVPPGKTVSCVLSLCPFTAKDDPKSLPMSLVSDKKTQRPVARFLQRSLTSVSHFGPHHFSQPQAVGYTPMDHFALLDWGLVDATLVKSTVQGEPLQARLFVGCFPVLKKQLRIVDFDVDVFDARGRSMLRSQNARIVVAADDRYESHSDEKLFYTHFLPDGQYVARVTARSGRLEPGQQPLLVKTFRFRLLGDRFKAASYGLALRGGDPPVSRFVRDLATKDGRIDGDRMSVPIGVEEAAGVSLESYPLRLGVPIPAGVLSPKAGFRLLSPNGKPVPAQTTVAGKWPSAGGDLSLQWVLVDFLAALPKNTYGLYTLSGSDKTPRTPGKPIARRSRDEITIDTGVARIVIPTKRVAIPGDVWVDLDADGKFTAAERVSGEVKPEDVWVTDQKGRLFRLTLEGDEAGVWLEENGPVRCTVKLVGWYRDKDGEPIGRGIVRISAFKNNSFLKIKHTFVFTADPYETQLRSYGLRFRARDVETGRFCADGGTHTTKVDLRVIQSRPDRFRFLQPRLRLAGRHLDGTFALVGKKSRMAVHLRDLWRMSPKKAALLLKDGAAELHFWPEEARDVDFVVPTDRYLPLSPGPQALADGVARTHEVVLDFTRTDKPLLGEYARLFDTPPIAAVPPRWLRRTEALGPLSPYDPERFPQAEELLYGMLHWTLRQRNIWRWYGEWAYGGIRGRWNPRTLGWEDAGPMGWTCNRQNQCLGFWHGYARTGDRLFRRLARTNVQHLMDLGTIHYTQRWPAWRWFQRRGHEYPWLGPADMTHSYLDAALAGYLLTGDLQMRDHARGLAEAYLGLSPAPGAYLLNAVDGLARMYACTGEKRYLDQARRLWSGMAVKTGDKSVHVGWNAGAYSADAVASLARWDKDVASEWVERVREGKKAPAGAGACAALYGLTGDAQFGRRAANLLAVAGWSRERSLFALRRGALGTVASTVAPAGLGRYFLALPFAMDAVVQSKTELSRAPVVGVFPSAVVILMWEQKDGAFTFTVPRPSECLLTGPDGNPVAFEEKEIPQRPGEPRRENVKLMRCTVKADARKGVYRLAFPKGVALDTFECSLGKVVFLVPPSFAMSAGATFYVWLEPGQWRGSTYNHASLYDPKGRGLASQTVLQRIPQQERRAFFQFAVAKPKTGVLLHRLEGRGLISLERINPPATPRFLHMCLSPDNFFAPKFSRAQRAETPGVGAGSGRAAPASR